MTPFAVAPQGFETAAIVLRTQGKQFSVSAPEPFPPSEFEAAWTAATVAWNSCTDDEHQAVWAQSWIVRQSVAFVRAIVAKGIRFPRQAGLAAFSTKRQRATVH